MQGIHIINDPNGTPAVLTIDLRNLDPDVSPLVAGLLAKMEQQVEAAERADFLYTSGMLANRACGDDEPECTDADLVERNPNCQPK